MHELLVVDDEPGICDLLSGFLSKKYRVMTTTTAREALRLCAANGFSMVISDINMPGMNGLELLSIIKQLHPHILTVLMTGYNVNDYINQALQYNIANIISKTAPFNFSELDAEIETLLSGEVFGLSRYLLDNGAVLAEYTIRSSVEARDVRDGITALFTVRCGTAGDMNLLLDEIVTNAIYHAPTNPDGTPKYKPFTDVSLEPGEFITVTCGADSEKYGIAILDNSGRLTKETVLSKIDHHLSGRGILDENGRGLHISRHFSDRMIINIKPMVKTEVILMNYFVPKYRGFKPLYINEL